MSQLVLPNTVDAGTEIVAAEHQANYVAIRDLINGNLEGGGGVNGNLKADGITARELQGSLIAAAGANNLLVPGVHSFGDLAVTPGAGLVLNFASGLAWVTDANAIVDANLLVPATVTGASVTIPANSSGNPRLDQIILTLTGWNTGTVSVLQGTPNAATTLANRTGAAALPAGAIRLADVLMPNAFAGPFVAGTHIRDRRPFSRGLHLTVLPTGDLALTDIWTAMAGGQSTVFEVGASQYLYVTATVGLTSGGAAGTAQAAVRLLRQDGNQVHSHVTDATGAYGYVAGFAGTVREPLDWRPSLAAGAAASFDVTLGGLRTAGNAGTLHWGFSRMDAFVLNNRT